MTVFTCNISTIASIPFRLGCGLNILRLLELSRCGPNLEEGDFESIQYDTPTFLHYGLTSYIQVTNPSFFSQGIASTSQNLQD
jgi:hypothetical protein